MAHSRERLEESIGWICTVMCGCFAYSVWWDDVHPRTDDRGFGHDFKVWIGGTLEAINHSTMQLGAQEVTLLNIRRLAEFFQPGRGRHKNIILASQFPGFETRAIIPKKLLGILDERIAHLTWNSVDFDMHFRMTAWQNLAGQRSVEFLDYLENEFKPESEEALEYIRGTRRFLTHYLERVKILDQEHPWPPDKDDG